MSHPDPLFDSYDDHNDFWGLPENELDDIREQMDADHGFDEDDEDFYDDSWDDESMDGDHDSAMESAGWGTDEDYGYFGGEDY